MDAATVEGAEAAAGLVLAVGRFFLAGMVTDPTTFLGRGSANWTSRYHGCGLFHVTLFVSPRRRHHACRNLHVFDHGASATALRVGCSAPDVASFPTP